MHTWYWIKLRCNYKKEILMIICGSNEEQIKPLRNHFLDGPGKATQVKSIYFDFRHPFVVFTYMH